MKTVFKYVLQSTANDIQMPAGAQVLHVTEQNNMVCMWILVDESAPVETRRFLMVGTGHREVPNDATYCGTTHIYTDRAILVLHVFEAKLKKACQIDKPLIHPV